MSWCLTRSELVVLRGLSGLELLAVACTENLGLQPLRHRHQLAQDLLQIHAEQLQLQGASAPLNIHEGCPLPVMTGRLLSVDPGECKHTLLKGESSSSLCQFQPRYLSHFPLTALNISAPYSTLPSAEWQYFRLDQVCQLVRFDNIKVRRGGRSRSVPFVTANAFLYVFFNARQHCRSRGSMGRKRQCCKLDYAPFIFISCPDLPQPFCATSVSSTQVRLCSGNEYSHGVQSVLQAAPPHIDPMEPLSFLHPPWSAIPPPSPPLMVR